MSRHGSKVPTTFYHRFTRDACKFADRFSNGRIVSVMEGGYSDRALTSGAMAHVCGMVDSDGGKFNVDPDWWNFENLLMVSESSQNLCAQWSLILCPCSWRSIPRSARAARLVRLSWLHGSREHWTYCHFSVVHHPRPKYSSRLHGSVIPLQLRLVGLVGDRGNTHFHWLDPPLYHRRRRRLPLLRKVLNARFRSVKLPLLLNVAVLILLRMHKMPPILLLGNRLSDRAHSPAWWGDQ